MPRSPTALLLRTDARRWAELLRRPDAARAAGVLLPVALAVGALWLAGEAARPDVSRPDGRILLAMMAAGPVAFFAYPVLFRPADDGLLRALGVAARARYAVRALRLLGASLGIVALFLVPFAATGEPLGPPAFVLATAALTAWGVSLLTQSAAARSMAAPGRRVGAMGATMGFDNDLRRVGALVYAPLPPAFLGGVLGAAAVSDAGAANPLVPAVVLATALALAWRAARSFEAAAPRFAARASELAFEPPAEADGDALVIGRGWARLLPRGAQAARARDAVRLDRAHRWTGRLVAPVAVVCVLALLRAGGDPAVRAGVTALAAALLAAQALAVIALGRAERGRTRWIDRGAGLGGGHRLVGRWAAAFGPAAGVAVPLALAWWAGTGAGGWTWIAAGAASSLAAAGASLAAAGR